MREYGLDYDELRYICKHVCPVLEKVDHPDAGFDRDELGVDPEEDYDA